MKRLIAFYVACFLCGAACTLITGVSATEGWQWWAVFIPVIWVLHTIIIGGRK